MDDRGLAVGYLTRASSNGDILVEEWGFSLVATLPHSWASAKVICDYSQS